MQIKWIIKRAVMLFFVVIQAEYLGGCVYIFVIDYGELSN